MAAWSLSRLLEEAAPQAIDREITEEALEHVQPGSGGGSEVEVEARVLREPATHLFVLVGGAVFHDEVELFSGRGAGVDQPQDARSFLVTMALLAGANNLAVGQVERGEERGRAMAFVVVRPAHHLRLLLRLDRKRPPGDLLDVGMRTTSRRGDYAEQGAVIIL